MKYPNTYKGLTKVFISEALGIVAVAVTLVAILFFPGAAPDATELSEDSPVLFAVSLIGIASLVIYLVGLVQARKDEDEFKLALIFMVIALACSILAGPAEDLGPYMDKMLEFASELLELVAFENVVTGVVHFAKEYRNDGIVSISKKMRVIITVVWIIVIAGKFLEFFSGELSGMAETVFGYLELADHILFMILLYKARKMLAGPYTGGE